jgi:hypothetical protein
MYLMNVILSLGVLVCVHDLILISCNSLMKYSLQRWDRLRNSLVHWLQSATTSMCQSVTSVKVSLFISMNEATSTGLRVG